MNPPRPPYHDWTHAMTHPPSPFPDDRRDPADDASLDAEFLLELAAWVDGSLPADRVRALEARLADDPPARALAASARLRPVTPADAAAPLPADLVARAAALVPAAGGPEIQILTSADSARRRRFRLVPALQVAGGLAACLGAAVIGWQLGGSAGQPAPTAARSVARTIPIEGELPSTDGALLAAASFGVFEDADEDPLEFLLLADALTGSTDSSFGGIAP